MENLGKMKFMQLNFYQYLLSVQNIIYQTYVKNFCFTWRCMFNVTQYTLTFKNDETDGKPNTKNNLKSNWFFEEF